MKYTNNLDGKLDVFFKFCLLILIYLKPKIEKKKKKTFNLSIYLS